MQIWQYNIQHTNIIAIQDVIISEKVRGKKRQLIIRNAINPTDVAKMSRTINHNSKYIWAISNANIDAAKDLRLTGIKKN